TQDQEAYHLYLRGRYHWYTRTKGALEKAREYFEEAARRDPNYALAHVGLADLYTAQAIYGYAPEHELAAKAASSVQRALAITDRIGDAYRADGFVKLFFDWTIKTAVQSLQRAVELDPSSGLSH